MAVSLKENIFLLRIKLHASNFETYKVDILKSIRGQIIELQCGAASNFEADLNSGL
jgi:hypothetical protein